MADKDVEAFIEFTQGYDGGARVIKRGMEASPMVERKYDLGEEEVIAFTSWLADNQALTAFHFHPSFPAENRRDYMRQHLDGVALLEEVRAKKDQDEESASSFISSRWIAALKIVEEAWGLLGRWARLMIRPVFGRSAEGSEKRPVEPKAISPQPVPLAAQPSLAERQRRALPESFAKVGALPHWERGYENGVLSPAEVIALKEDRRTDQEGRPISRTVH